MTRDKLENENNPAVKQNWSDFENSLIEIFNEININDEERLTSEFNQFQVEFSNFLNEIITPEMLAKLGNTSSQENVALNSFTKF